ncbi:hypothetical protein D9M68_912500 [compost metagenome]
MGLLPVGHDRASAAPGLAQDQTFFCQLQQCPSHRDTSHAELFHQGQLPRQAGFKLTIAQLLAQHQVDLVVLGQWQLCVHAAIVR